MKDNDLISRAAAIDAVYYKPNHKMAIEVLKEVPAVDAVPVVHGRWVISPGSPWPIRDCSVCGEQQISAYATKYCPNCGAKMDLEV